MAKLFYRPWLVILLWLYLPGAWAQQNFISNSSFESNQYGTFPGYSFQTGNGSISGWSGTGHFGLNPAQGVSAFANNGTIPHGSQVAFLQNAGSSLSQTVSGLTIGQRYELRFHYNARSGFVTPILRATVDGLGLFHAPVCSVGDTNNYHLSVASFVARKASVVLSFEQIASGDATALIDNVLLRHVSPAAIPPYTTTNVITSVEATPTQILLHVNAVPGQKIRVAELPPYGTKSDAATGLNSTELTVASGSIVSLPRYDGCNRDRLYSGFITIITNVANTANHFGEIKYVEAMSGVAAYNQTFPSAPHKKGLQVQMNDDAIALGVKHAAINLNLSQLIDLNQQPGNPTWTVDGETFYFHQGYLDSLGVKQLSDAGVIVSFVVIYLPHSSVALDSILVHPGYNRPESLPAFNTSAAEGALYFRASMEFLADYYSRPNQVNGRVVNYIIGNEVTAHWYWYNMGLANMETFVEDYLRTVRIAQTAVRRITTESRVYVSLDHHWNSIYEGNSLRAFAGRAFLDRFNTRSKAGGNFDWHVAYHPYPENLFESRTWLDTSATTNVLTSPKITFKNIELLPEYLGNESLLHRGTQRRIILSEQGFHADYDEASERRQAAAYCYAFHKTAHLPGIDSFILHRHVDHAHEGGLNLGLWRRVPNSIADPHTTKPIYEVFKQAGTANWESAFQFALPEIGITNWNQLITWSSPVVLVQPTSQTGIVDGSVSFAVAVGGSPAPKLEWRFNGAALTNGLGISGATSATLNLTNLQSSMAGNYSLFLRNGHGTTVSSNALLTVISMFEGWRRQHFNPTELQDIAISGPEADPDGDGFVNALEYAMNLDPRTPNDRTLLQPQLMEESGQIYLALRYKERLGTSGLSLTNEASPDLLQWNAAPVTTRMISQDAVT
ncbi:MAG: DUF5722 domain-containing protein, partial [Limisphaerales bacterium]